MLKNIIFLSFLPFYFGCVNSQSVHKEGIDKLGYDSSKTMYAVTSEDSSMNLAIQKAKNTINEFELAFKNKNPNYSEFALKKQFITTYGGGEHMWIAGLREINGDYKGFVNNESEFNTEVKYGDSVIVKKEEITDWMYLDNNILKGGFTIREIRNKLNKEERINLDKELGFVIED